MEYKINRDGLLTEMGIWNGFLGRSVRLIACGGTGLTLLGVKDSTKDIDLMVPDEWEHSYLLSILKQFGYKQVTGYGWARGGGFVFDLFRGNRIHTTELLESPLEKGNHLMFKEYSRIYLGILNYYDLIISKLFRGTSVDFDDCVALVRVKHREVDFGRLCNRYRDTAAYDVSEINVLKNLDTFIHLIRKEGLYNDNTLTS
ncbi:MAG: hypothetical protein NTX71_11675 [Candidatus Aureabacteria bacterium]|nr:hypothetical protein [Candidatus Auribacterota bacterium]